MKKISEILLKFKFNPQLVKIFLFLVCFFKHKFEASLCMSGKLVSAQTPLGAVTSRQHQVLIRGSSRHERTVCAS